MLDLRLCWDTISRPIILSGPLLIKGSWCVLLAIVRTNPSRWMRLPESITCCLPSDRRLRNAFLSPIERWMKKQTTNCFRASRSTRRWMRSRWICAATISAVGSSCAGTNRDHFLTARLLCSCVSWWRRRIWAIRCSTWTPWTLQDRLDWIHGPWWSNIAAESRLSRHKTAYKQEFPNHSKLKTPREQERTGWAGKDFSVVHDGKVKGRWTGGGTGQNGFPTVMLALTLGWSRSHSSPCRPWPTPLLL